MTTLVRNASAKVRTLAQKKSVLIAAGSLLIGATAMIATNPGRPAYIDYASERLSKEFKRECDELDDDINVTFMLELPTRDLCRSFVGSADLVGRGAAKLVINGTTEPRKNFGFFSIYTTKILGRQFKTIGLAGNFITFYSK